jgi:hypothetical protein
VEPISPELALIDPELARADLARTDLARTELVRTDAIRPPASPLPPAPERRAGRLHAAPILLAVSLAVNGFLLASLAADEWRAYPIVAASSAHASLLPPETPPAADVEAAAPRKLPARQSHSTASVEQKILAALVQSPTGKLPPALVDRTTGLAKNNLQAVCRKVSDSFLCTVRPARHKPGEGLSVRYKSGRLTWYPYRPG